LVDCTSFDSHQPTSDSEAVKQTEGTTLPAAHCCFSTIQQGEDLSCGSSANEQIECGEEDGLSFYCDININSGFLQRGGDAD
jgi:hypothetical protein